MPIVSEPARPLNASTPALGSNATTSSGSARGPQATAGVAPSPTSVPDDRFDRGAAATPVEVFFTPHDDAYAREVALIDEVIAARQADPASYSDADNPYRVLYAVFNLRNEQIVKRLFAAAEAGVKVQVLVEADQISDARPWNKVDEWFEQQGLTVIRSDREATEAAKAGAHLIGIDKRSLMHMKSRIFRYKDPDSGEARAKVLSGSLNPGGAPVANEENVNLLDGTALADRFEDRFYEIRAHRQAHNDWDEDAGINVLFTPLDQGSVTPTKKIFDWIDHENELVLISVFALRNLKTKGEQQSLVDKLAAAQQRGAKVLVITDRRKSDGTDADGKRVMMYGRPAHDDPTDELLEQAGVRVLELVNPRGSFSAVHGKSMICGLDDMKVVTGAGNWTIAALGSDKKNPRNEESFLFIDSGKLDDNATGRAYLGNFLQLLRDYDQQYPAAAKDLIAELQTLPHWPRVPLELGGLARAHPGEELYLVSDDPEIKKRTRPGDPGLRIDTAPSSGSPPFRPQDPVLLPFGSVVEFRLARRDAQSGEVRVLPGAQVVKVEG